MAGPAANKVACAMAGLTAYVACAVTDAMAGTVAGPHAADRIVRDAPGRSVRALTDVMARTAGWTIGVDRFDYGTFIACPASTVMARTAGCSVDGTLRLQSKPLRAWKP